MWVYGPTGNGSSYYCRNYSFDKVILDGMRVIDLQGIGFNERHKQSNFQSIVFIHLAHSAIAARFHSIDAEGKLAIQPLTV